MRGCDQRVEKGAGKEFGHCLGEGLAGGGFSHLHSRRSTTKDRIVRYFWSFVRLNN